MGNKHQLQRSTPVQCLVLIGLLLGSNGKILPAQAEISPANDGTGTIVNPAGNHLDITGGQLSGDGANLFHSFTRFGLDQGQTANFLANPNLQNILGRVTGGEASLINGLLQISGGSPNLYLMNPAGIVFGSNASLNLPAAFTATTASKIGLGNQEFPAIGSVNYAALVGTPDSFAFAAQAGTIVNAANLLVNPGQSLTLLGGTVVNTGSLTAPDGEVTIVAVPGSHLVKLNQAGSLLSLEFSPLTQAPNFNIQPPNLPQLLTGGNASNATGLTVNADGTVQLSGSGIEIPTAAGTAIVAGNISVAGETATAQINIVGTQVGLVGANLNASGSDGGGTIRIGGDYQGQGQIPNADRVVVTADSTITADALEQGQGGRVIVWADDHTRFAGNLSAQGGPAGGDGGFAEVSGKNTLSFEGRVDLTAAQGQTGTLLLDPTSITIEPGSNNPSDLPSGGGSQLLFTDNPGGASTVNNGTLNAALANVLLQSSGSITFNAPIAITTSGVGLTAEALGDITVNASITTQGGNVFLNALPSSSSSSGTVFINNATISTNGGAITLQGASRTGSSFQDGVILSNAQLNSGSGTITLQGTGTPGIAISGGGTPGGTGISATGTTIQSTSGAISLTGTGGAGGDGLLASGGSGGTGISITNTTIQSTSGAISLTGTGKQGGLGDNSSGFGSSIFAGFGGNGIRSTSSTVQSTNGPISFTATGGGGGVGVNTRSGSGGDGIRSTSSTVQSTNGPISFRAIGGAAGPEGNSDFTSGGTGIFSQLDRIQADSGGITLTGTGGDGTVSSGGGGVDSFLTTFQTTSAPITITGNAGASFGFYSADGISLSGSSIRSSSGAVSLAGTGSRGASSSFEIVGIFASPGSFSPTAEVSFEPLVDAGSGAIRLSGKFSGSAVPLVLKGGDITIGDVDAPEGIVLTSQGTVITGNLSSAGYSGDPGGDITIKARTSITTGTIDASRARDSSASISTSPSNGGNVSLDPINDIQVTWINTQGYFGGKGGNVTISTDRFFRATGSFVDQNGTVASISTAGGEGGRITIRHGGASNNTPFIVGDASTNGTAAALTTGASNSIRPTESFNESVIRGNIQISTGSGVAPCLVNNCVSPGGETPLQVANPNETRTLLQGIEAATGIKPAIIYLSFVAAGTSSTNDPTERDDQRTQEVTRQLERPNPGNSVLALEQRRDDQLEILLVTTSGEPIRVRLPVTRAQVLAQARRFFRGANDLRFSFENNYLDEAQRLYQWLIAPIEAELQAKKIDNLVLIADSGLRTLPFAALHDGQQFLVEKYSIGLMPSLSLTDTRPASLKNKPVLAMGAATFPILPNQNPLDDLPAVPIELEAITRLIPRSRSILNSDFTLENLQQQRQRFPFAIVHLATHGEFNAGVIQNSFIRLWNSSLRLDQLRQLQFNNPPVELLVLSACRTAVGNDTAELGFAGIAAQTGAKSVLASYWQVDDVGTLALMSEFYHHLQSAPIRAEALRRAQVAMLKGQVTIEAGELVFASQATRIPLQLNDPELSKVLRHPYYWAGFTIVGNPW